METKEKEEKTKNEYLEMIKNGTHYLDWFGNNPHAIVSRRYEIRLIRVEHGSVVSKIVVGFRTNREYLLELKEIVDYYLQPSDADIRSFVIASLPPRLKALYESE